MPPKNESEDTLEPREDLKDSELLSALKEELIGRFSQEGFGLKKRENTIMTRVSFEVLNIIDALVELAIFNSRSEAAAYLISEAIDARREQFEKIAAIVGEIKRKKIEAVKTILEKTDFSGSTRSNK